MTVYAQYFCTVQDLINDAQSPIADEARLFQAIREACDYLQKEIGWFIPVISTRRFSGHDRECLIVPPLLAITSIVNDGDTLSASDYILKPDNGYWQNGPYGEIHIDPDSSLLLAWADYIDAVVIVGSWGLYLRSAVTGATVADTTEQSSSQTTLKVSNGGKVSPGMVLLVGSEQELVTGWDSPTTNVTTLNGNITANDEVITLTSGAAVNIGETIRIDLEQMKVRDIRNNSVLVTRGWNNTQRVAHTTSTQVDAYRTVTVDRAVNGTTAAAHANGLAISRYYAPDDVQYLAKQIATLIVQKAKSGYQGRTGNAETGVVMYHDAFPRFDIERVKNNYNLKVAG